jgi:CO/xanthine dehydrogenase Mo-binding subunit
MTVVGAPVRRREGFDKVTGRALYVDDLALPGMLLARTVRAPVARGRLEGIEFAPGVPWDEVVVVTASDIPGRNLIPLIAEDQPCLATGEIRHREEPVALLAHADRQVLDRAVAGIRLRVTPAPAVLDLDAATEIMTDHTLARGEAEAALREADLVVEGVYETGAQEHVYIEPQGMLAEVDAGGAVVVRGSLQCPYYVQPAVAAVLGLAPGRVRVVQMATGGGFGGKEEYPSVIACHAALLAWKARRPVKLVYARDEDMRATTKRHPSRIRHRTAVTRDGRLLALDTDLVLDGGAYLTLSPVVLSRALVHAPGVYRWPHLRVRGRVMRTSHPPHGAFRGFGAPQAFFALEVHLDRVAAALGMDPVELRRRNLLRAGDLTATGQAVDAGVDPPTVLDRALAESRYDERRAAARAANARSPRVRRGVGLAAFFHGAGFTGGGEARLASEVALRLAPEGVVEIQASSVEMGQGTATALPQIVAGALGIPAEGVVAAPADTALIPDSGPTVASRSTMVVGGLLERAAREIRDRLQAEAGLPGGHTAEQFAAAARAWTAAHGPLVARARFEPPAGWTWNDATFSGTAYAAHAWACYVAEVAVDTRTGEVEVVDVTAVQEVGRVINPVMARGQVQGGVVQGLGFALSEHVVWRDGVMANARLTDYIVPTSADAPPIRVVFMEVPFAGGGSGAKGLGELPMDGTAPAVVNAVNAALGTGIARLPALPERILEAWAAGSGAADGA